jgi:hypothetical protein
MGLITMSERELTPALYRGHSCRKYNSRHAAKGLLIMTDRSEPATRHPKWAALPDWLPIAAGDIASLVGAELASAFVVIQTMPFGVRTNPRPCRIDCVARNRQPWFQAIRQRTYKTS